MKEIAVFVPYERERLIAEEAVQDLGMSRMAGVYTIRTNEAIDRAREMVNGGVRVIIARGLQSELIRAEMNVPIVDIALTSQEIGLLVRDAKKIAGRESPVVALIIFKNSVGDLGHLAELMDVRLIIRYPAGEAQVRAEIEEILPQKPDVVIGGTAVCSAARELGIRHIMLRSTGESERQALVTARQMLHSADLERMNRAQIDTVMDSAVNGIIRINSARAITSINQQARQLLVLPGIGCIGAPLESILPSVDMDRINAVLRGEADDYTTSVIIRDHAWQMTITAVSYDEANAGAVISLHDLSVPQQIHIDRMRESYLLGYVAHRSFRDLHTKNENMQSVIETARRFSITSGPVLIKAPFGTETQDLAEAIHLNSMRRSAPFVAVDISGRSETEQCSMVFGTGKSDRASCALDHAAHGTLFIVGIDKAGPAFQHALKQILLPRYCYRSAFGSNQHYDVRIIACAEEDFGVEGFSSELYYLLCGLTLTLPPLRDRPEDLYDYFRQFLEEACSRHNAHLHINKDVRARVCTYPWPGNIPQIKRFCEALVLLRNSSHISSDYVSSLYERTYPIGRTDTEIASDAAGGDERQRIDRALCDCRGSRAKAAAMLGISTSTLWRKIKKYGI